MAKMVARSQPSLPQPVMPSPLLPLTGLTFNHPQNHEIRRVLYAAHDVGSGITRPRRFQITRCHISRVRCCISRHFAYGGGGFCVKLNLQW